MEPWQQTPPTTWPGQQPPAIAPSPPPVEVVQARYAEARARLVRHALIWGAVAGAALIFSLWSFVQAQDAAADGSSGGSYWVLWGPVVFGGWRAIQAAMGAARISDEARRVGRTGTFR